MERFLKQNKYLIVSTLSRMYLLFILVDEQTYIKALYSVDSVVFHLVMGLGITLLDILYISQASFYIYHMKQQVVLRLGNHQYYCYVIKKVLFYFFTFSIVNVGLQIVFYQNLSYHVVVYDVLLAIITLCILKFDNEHIHHYLVLVILIIVTMLKFMI